MNKKALVVEDDKNIAELLRLYLEKDGFDVVIAGDNAVRDARIVQDLLHCGCNSVLLCGHAVVLGMVHKVAGVQCIAYAAGGVLLCGVIDYALIQEIEVVIA